MGGFAKSLLRYNQVDINKVMENLVFNHLKTSGYSIKVGQLGKKEIDFIGEKDGERLYIQVAYVITEENKEREFGNLLEVQDNYPKIVVSMDTMVGDSSYKGIKQINLRRFLAS